MPPWNLRICSICSSQPPTAAALTCTVSLSTPNLPCAADDESSAGFSATMFLSNVSPAPVAFKVKTTKPERYLVRPNQGVLAAGAVHVDVKGACSC